jgi:hypothetical protein
LRDGDEDSGAAYEVGSLVSLQWRILWLCDGGGIGGGSALLMISMLTTFWFGALTSLGFGRLVIPFSMGVGRQAGWMAGQMGILLCSALFHVSTGRSFDFHFELGGDIQLRIQLQLRAQCSL